jgi:hypothetical protein
MQGGGQRAPLKLEPVLATPAAKYWLGIPTQKPLSAAAHELLPDGEPLLGR